MIAIKYSVILSLLLTGCTTSQPVAKKAPSFKLTEKSPKKTTPKMAEKKPAKKSLAKPVPKERLPKDMQALLKDGYIFSNVMGVYKSGICDWKKCRFELQNVTIDSVEKGQMQQSELKELKINIPNLALQMSAEMFPQNRSPQPGRSYMATGKDLIIIPKNIKKGKIKDEVKLIFINSLFHKDKGMQTSPLSRAIMLQSFDDEVVGESRENIGVMTKDW